MRPLAALLVALAPGLACGDNSGREDTDASTSITTAGNTTTHASFPQTTGEPTTTQPADDTTGPVDPSTTSDPSTSLPDPSTSTSTSTGPGTTDDTGFDTDPFDCDPQLKATVRDFKQEHPDFEDFTGDAAYEGLVQAALGPDMKPVYANPGATPQTSGPDAFAQWYHDVPNVNIPFAVDLLLTEVSPGLFSYQNGAFFPIDGQGWNNEGNSHNFHFTTEIHTSFVYKGGEQFTFTGDDDLWLFINGNLAIDLGGTHPELTDTVNLDASAAALGITVGGSYAMDIFHAERHTDASNFRIDTSIQCFIVPG